MNDRNLLIEQTNLEYCRVISESRVRLSGMKRGVWGNVAYGGTVNPPRNRKGGAGNPPPTGRRAPVLSQPSDSKLKGDASG